jgi:ferredoxin
MSKRKIIKIDEDKCNGCGQCIPNCPEGALEIIDGKARLVSDSFCDGLGVCLGYCPQGAISIKEREAEKYEERPACGCPSAQTLDLRKKEQTTQKDMPKGISELINWPVQIKLVPVNAPYLEGADLLITADCLPFAYADFHRDLLRGKILLMGCPKLDDAQFYQEKLSQVFKNNSIKSVTCAHMEVPCCFGLVKLVKDALSASGKDIPFNEITVTIKGEKLK